MVLDTAETAPGSTVDAPFEIRGQLRTLLTLRVLAPRDLAFFPRLADSIANAPNFFRHAPVVLDLAVVADEPPVNLAEFARRLRQQKLVPVGVQNGGEAWNQMAINAGLAVLPPAQLTRGGEAPSEAAPTAVAEPPPSPTKIVVEPVRGGQQVYAEGGDLIVMAQVSNGAEIVADGHIHCFHRLRGRAFAGARGDESARIFVHSLEAELVSVAGLYMVNEEIDPALLSRSVQIRCAGDRLAIEPLPVLAVADPKT